MIAKLERTQSTAKRNKDLTLNNWGGGGATTMNKQQQNHRLRTDSRLRYRGGLKAFYWRQIFALGSVVVKTQKCLARKEVS